MKWNNWKMKFFFNWNIGGARGREKEKQGICGQLRYIFPFILARSKEDAIPKDFKSLPKRMGEGGRCVRKQFCSWVVFFSFFPSCLLHFFKKRNSRYSRCSYASMPLKPSRWKLKDSAPESLIRTCHRSNEYHLNCFVYWWSLDVDLICACVLSSSAWLR